MIGNNIPGLKYLFDTQECGVCIESICEKDICDAIRKIDDNYDKYSSGSKRFYLSTDSKEEVKAIISVIKNNWDTDIVL